MVTIQELLLGRGLQPDLEEEVRIPDSGSQEIISGSQEMISGSQEMISRSQEMISADEIKKSPKRCG